MEQRRRTSLPVSIEEALNKQVELEAFASASYLAMSSWCADQGYENSSKFFIRQSGEERDHMIKIFSYITEVGGFAKSPAIEPTNHEFESLKDVFETALTQEIKVTQSINSIVELARKEKDFATDSFLQWFIQEQTEEEQVARRCIELFHLLGQDKMALLMIDERIFTVLPAEGTTQA